MWPRFGIKIGNSTVCLAVVKNDGGKIEVVANKQGDRVSQACLLSDCGEIEVGITAKQKMSSKLLASVANNFLLFSNNLQIDEKINAQRYIPCKYNLETDKFDLISNDDDKPHRSMTPFEVCVEFFKSSFDLARQCHFTEDHPSVVLSIPDYYPYDCWHNLSKAAEEAGFHVSQIITEPTAAILGHELGENNNNSDNTIINCEQNINKRKIILFIKSGGICSSFSLIEIKNDLYTILSTCGPYYIGGKQFTEVLVEFIATEFNKKYHLDPNESRRSMAKIRNAADNCKHILTTLPSTQIYIDSLMDGVDFNIQMSRARYDNLIQPVINEFITTLTKSVASMETNDKETINEIVLAGATLKIPKIQSMICSTFPNATLNLKFPTDEIVAIGCARQSTYLLNTNEQDLERYAKLSLLNDDIYIWHNCEDKKLLLFKNGTIVPKTIEIDIEINDIINEHNNDDDDNNDNDDDNDNDNKLQKNVSFNIQLENKKIEKLLLLETKEPINGILRIEANITFEEDDELPSIFLRAV